MAFDGKLFLSKWVLLLLYFAQSCPDRKIPSFLNERLWNLIPLIRRKIFPQKNAWCDNRSFLDVTLL